jgi:DNA-binding PadR family transcriptional regulator
MTGEGDSSRIGNTRSHWVAGPVGFRRVCGRSSRSTGSSLVASEKKKKPTLVSDRSPLRAAVVAVLLEGPSHGYDVARRLKRWVGPSWRIYAKHIYTVLKSLERDGLVWSEELPGDGPKRDRRVYHPTPEAVQARAEWMQAPVLSTLVRADVEARLIFSQPEEAPSLLEMLDRYEEDVIADLEAVRAVDTPPVAWRGRLLSRVRQTVAMRLDAEMAGIEETRRDIEEYIAESS